MFPVDLNLEPRGSQPTISIHADGQVVVWLGGMRHPPFDTEAGREELRKALNELDGVHIHRRQVNGWPRFPLSVLEDPANLLRLVAVLDRIATESHTVPAVEEAPPVEAVEPEPDRRSRQPSPHRLEPEPMDPEPPLERRFLGWVEVDSGTLLVGDPLYSLPHAEREQIGDRLRRRDPDFRPAGGLPRWQAGPAAQRVRRGRQVPGLRRVRRGR